MTPDHEVVVIGAGPGGIAAGVALTRAGINDFAILERAHEVGGSWRDNDYPGIGVDVPALAYQYSFARKADWTRLFPKGDEVKQYHVDVATRFGLMDHVRFATSVQREEWDEDNHLWRLHCQNGTITARFVITAVGAFINPKEDIGIPGLDDYAGVILRPTSWAHDFPLAGKRVGIVGTGASSVQITPAIAPTVASLTVFQRTPVWCLPKPDITLSPWFQKALRVPGVAAGLHGCGLLAMEGATRFLSSTPLSVAKPVVRGFDSTSKRAYARYVKRVVGASETADHLTPTYGPLTKRPTISTGYLRAFNRDNVRLVTEGIASFTEKGIRTVDGEEHIFDAIVLATGYDLFSDPESYEHGAIVGRDGFDLGDFYNTHSLQAYESVAVPGLPNRWMLAGPYSWTGTGWHLLVEVSSAHAVRAIGEARKRGATSIEVKPEAHQAYHAEVLRRRGVIQYYFTEQNKGVRTYYVNSQGESVYVRPSSVLEARWRSKHFPLDNYRYEGIQA